MRKNDRRQGSLTWSLDSKSATPSTAKEIEVYSPTWVGNRSSMIIPYELDASNAPGRLSLTVESLRLLQNVVVLCGTTSTKSNSLSTCLNLRQLKTRYSKVRYSFSSSCGVRRRTRGFEEKRTLKLMFSKSSGEIRFRFTYVRSTFV